MPTFPDVSRARRVSHAPQVAVTVAMVVATVTVAAEARLEMTDVATVMVMEMATVATETPHKDKQSHYES